MRALFEEGSGAVQRSPRVLPTAGRFSCQQTTGTHAASRAGQSCCSPTPTASLVLMPRSLLVFADEAYTSHLHGIDMTAEERLDASVCNLHLCPPEVAALRSSLPSAGSGDDHDPADQAAAETFCAPDAKAPQEEQQRPQPQESQEESQQPEQDDRGPAGPDSSGGNCICGTLPRGVERMSLTVRRVPRVVKGFMQLAVKGGR